MRSTYLDFPLKAKSDASPDVMLESNTPAFTGLGAIDGLPVGKSDNVLADGIFEFNLTTPIRTLRKIRVPTRGIKAWTA